MALFEDALAHVEGADLGPRLAFGALTEHVELALNVTEDDIIAVHGAKTRPHASGIPPRQQSETVVLDLMDPARADRRLQGGTGQARFDEAVQARERDTQQHGAHNWAALGSESSRMSFAAEVWA